MTVPARALKAEVCVDPGGRRNGGRCRLPPSGRRWRSHRWRAAVGRPPGAESFSIAGAGMPVRSADLAEF
jgi:hypothetical protein